ncbi:hypothetical protein OU683_01895 [Salinimicrobium sp. TH3]|nr:hypothetical protein [Salinimicrobium sp. TH3]
MILFPVEIMAVHFNFTITIISRKIESRNGDWSPRLPHTDHLKQVPAVDIRRENLGRCEPSRHSRSASKKNGGIDIEN